MKTKSPIPPENEDRTNRVYSTNEPCWLTMPFRSDRVNSPDEPSWIAMLVFNDSDEMEALIEGWGTSPANTAPFAGASTG